MKLAAKSAFQAPCCISRAGELSQSCVMWAVLCVCHTQIHSECKRFGKAYNLRSVAVYGGGSMWEQAKALQEGAEIVVCTPVSTVATKTRDLHCSTWKTL